MSRSTARPLPSAAIWIPLAIGLALVCSVALVAGSADPARAQSAAPSTQPADRGPAAVSGGEPEGGAAERANHPTEGQTGSAMERRRMSLGHPEPGSPVPPDPAPVAILLVSGHTKGWISPCGCPGYQAGGIARRAGYAELLRETFPGVPVRFLDLGGLVQLGSQTARLTTDAVLDSLVLLGYEGANVSFWDLGWRYDDAQYIAERLKVSRFSANVAFQDTRELAFPPYRILSVRGEGGREPGLLRIGVLGLLSDQRRLFAFGPEGRTLIALPVEGALKRYVPELRSKVDLVVVLAETTVDPFHLHLDEIPGVDAVVYGTGPDLTPRPARAHGVPLVAVGTQGKYVSELRIHSTGGRLAVEPYVHWLDWKYPENETIARSVEARLDAINESSREDVAKDSLPAPSALPYVGAEACASCHEEAAAIWKASRHARAFRTLEALKRDYTLTCVVCHVTGLNSPSGGGFADPLATAHLTGVQCEACHGPGEAHTKDPAVAMGKVPENFCAGCHTKEQDPTFDQATRWRVVAH